PFFKAATPVDALPEKGSRIVPPGGVISFPHHSASCQGNGAGWPYALAPFAIVATSVHLATAGAGRRELFWTRFHSGFLVCCPDCAIGSPGRFVGIPCAFASQ